MKNRTDQIRSDQQQLREEEDVEEGVSRAGPDAAEAVSGERFEDLAAEGVSFSCVVSRWRNDAQLASPTQRLV